MVRRTPSMLHSMTSTRNRHFSGGLVRSSGMLHRLAQLSHTGGNTSLETRADCFGENTGLITSECAALRHSGASTDVFEGPDESTHRARKRKLDHCSSDLGFNNRPCHSAVPLCPRGPTRSGSEWPIDFDRFYVRGQRPVANVVLEAPREFNCYTANDRVLEHPCVFV